MCSQAAMAPTSDAATTHGECSDLPPMVATCPDPDGSATSWSWTRRRGQAAQLPDGHLVQPGTPFSPPKGRGIQQVDPRTSLAAWLPIQPGLVPHGLRHSLKTWMTEDGIREVLQARRLGHQVPGMQGIYTHVSAAMREELKAALQARWENSLRARAALASHSPVSLLDDLLEPLRHQAPLARLPRWEPGPGQGRGIVQNEAFRASGVRADGAGVERSPHRPGRLVPVRTCPRSGA